MDVGETASLQVAGPNSPELRVGATLTVRVLVSGQVVAVGETTVEKAS
ncbi:hypothetical protein [Halobacterium sp. KA-6]|nr:hypothetical protein [Halobacterium sp. KA-6]MCD2202910.1 hypothetical protein [Halobacterium sp. KA-6]